MPQQGRRAPGGGAVGAAHDRGARHIGGCVLMIAYWLPRDVLRVSGPDAESFLQGQLSQDLAAIGLGEAAWALLLQPQGKVDALLRVARIAGDAFVLDTDA